MLIEKKALILTIRLVDSFVLLLKYFVMNKLRTASLLLLFTLALFGCKSTDGYKPNAGGKAGELLIVIDDSWRKSDAGETLRSIVRQPYLGLPQPEPMFDVSVTSYAGFNDFMKTYRNLVLTKISPNVEVDTVLYYKDVWAKGQAMVRINAKTEEGFVKLIKRQEIKLLSFFNKAERDRSVKSYRKYINKEFSDKINIKVYQRVHEIKTYKQKLKEMKSGTYGLLISLRRRGNILERVSA